MRTINALVSQALLRLLHTLDKSLPQSPEIVRADLEFLLFKCRLASGVAPDVDVAAVVRALTA